MSEQVTEPVRRLIEKYEKRIEKLEVANGKLCAEINRLEEELKALKQ